MARNTDSLPMADRVKANHLISQPDPSGASPICQRGFIAPPAIGTLVRFRRSPTHHPETGTVWGRQFGTGIVEVVDHDGKPLRLMRGCYEVIPDENA